MHSPWGIIGHARKETGYTRHAILWRASWVNVMMELADRPGFKKSDGVVRVDKDKIKEHRQRFNNGRQQA